MEMGGGAGKMPNFLATHIKERLQGDVPGKQAGIMHAIDVIAVPIFPKSNLVAYTA